MRKSIRCVVNSALLSLAVATIATAQTYTFEAFDVPIPGAYATSFAGINDSGQIIGNYRSADGILHGFIRNPGGTIVTIDFPGAFETEVLGNNDLGDVVGYYVPMSGCSGYGSYLPTVPFKYSQGMYTVLPEYPGTSCRTLADDINNAGQIAGQILGGGGYLLNNGTFTPLGNAARSINNTGSIVGQIGTAEGWAGFILSGTTYTAFFFPGAGWTDAYGTNNLGDVVGLFTSPEGYRGFLRTSTGAFSEVNYPGTSVPGSGVFESSTVAINSAGVIVGYFGDASGYHGWIATPSAPTPSAQIQNLITSTLITDLTSNIQSQLDAKLNAALATLDATKNNSATTAANQLQAFANAVKADVQGGKLTCAQATPLVDAAQKIVASLGRLPLAVSLPCR